jgi:competence protein ComEC
MTTHLLRLRAYIYNQFAAEYDRFILLWPVALMLGIGGYFSLSDEPPLWLSAGMLCLSLTVILLSRKKRFYLPAISIFFIVLGFSVAHLRAHLVATPLLTEELRNRVVEGRVDEMEPVEKKMKLVISRPVIEGLPEAETPERLRISFRDKGTILQVGDRVRFTATLYPLPTQSMPGSYDFARHFYFRSIGGNGFAFRAPEVIASSQQSGFSAWISNLRHHIGEDMRASMPGETGSVAAAMTVGEVGPIPAATQENLRSSGLAHMLSISGLHLSIAAGLLFFNIRLLLTLYPPFALRFPVKKIAAIIAPIGAFIYLLLSGSPVPAVRSFIMVLVIFLGIMLDRESFTLRTLTMAAGLILLVLPESMLGASFQMSFAATLAIISFTERFGHMPGQPIISRGGRMLKHIYSIAFTSLAATLATAPFVLYNFNRFSLFSVLANMIVVPLASFVIMPGIVISLLLMPFGWQKLGYIPLEYGVSAMLKTSDWVSSLPYSSLALPAPTTSGLIIAVGGLLWLFLMRQRWRLLGIPLIIGGLSTMMLHVSPDVIISRDGRQVMARLENGTYTLLKGSPHSFTAQSWLRTEGQEEAVKLQDSGVECTKEICSYTRNGRNLLLVKDSWDSEAAKEACARKVDVLVAWHYLRPYRCPEPTLLIGRNELEARGAHQLWLDKEGVRVKYTREGNGQRLWQLPLEEE